ncbi:hypothetical protein GC209_12380 [bacterium]|nr:hypothetical protein [bacterium]
MLALPLALTAHGAGAADYQGAMKAYLDSSIRTWAEDPAIVSAIEAANTARAGYDQAKIDALDAAWKAEVGKPDTPTITPIQTNAASDFLRKQVEASGGKVTEAFVTDNKGLNVAVSSPTSDMWQGDEDKFSKVFPNGPDGLFFGSVELDESTQTYEGQVSISIVDPATKEVIGTLTVGINADAL